MVIDATINSSVMEARTGHILHAIRPPANTCYQRPPPLSLLLLPHHAGVQAPGVAVVLGLDQEGEEAPLGSSAQCDRIDKPPCLPRPSRGPRYALW